MLEEALGIEEEKGELMESIENIEELPVAEAEILIVKEQQPELLGKYKRIDLLI